MFQLIKPAYATPWDWTTANQRRCVGQNIIVGDNKITDIATIQGFECLFYNILQVIVIIAGIAFFAMFINGGFKYLFSGNDPKKTALASSTLTMALIGLIGVIASWLILRFIQNFTGINVTDFVIPG